jgi:hypothetical protein
LKEQVGITLTLYQLWDDDFGVVLKLFTFNIKKEVCEVLDSFLSFKKKYEEKKKLTMLSLMLDSQLIFFHLMSSFVCCKQGISIIEKYNKKSLYPMLLKCYHHLHLVTDCEIKFVN